MASVARASSKLNLLPNTIILLGGLSLPQKASYPVPSFASLVQIAEDCTLGVIVCQHDRFWGKALDLYQQRHPSLFHYGRLAVVGRRLP